MPEPATAALLGFGLLALALRHRRARQLCIVLLAIASAEGANAGWLAVTPDKSWYYIGETITLTVTGDDQGHSAYGIFGRLTFDGRIVDNRTRTQTDADGAGSNWIRGTLAYADTNAAGAGSFSDAFNQVATYADSAPNYPAIVATVTLIGQA
ncbi:MAG: PEP-CTERM sorting domain-containing protein, partial [Vicinamibacterales bacterium]